MNDAYIAICVIVFQTLLLQNRQFKTLLTGFKTSHVLFLNNANI